jgi:chromosome segregation protein
MRGFKSFADKIVLDFNTGITSVVGPNGSGKSNIADAIRWVLGEQSIKTLRGSKMEDIIFSGTQHRKPVGYAQVSLTIDNVDNIVPLEYDEVTVTRRVYRSGESEFLINKSPCRLKDIKELFVDTGIGKDGYSIIGQGRIDEILSNRSEDRRAIFEEASGIMKYKLRKLEAERKLDHTEQNLIRINDIIFELESQLEPLRIESEKAKEYLEHREKLKKIEVNVFLVNIDKFKEKLAATKEKMDTLKSDIIAEEESLEKIKGINQTGTEKMKTLERALEKAKSDFYELDSKMEKYSSKIEVNEEKISGIHKNNERLKLEIEDHTKKLESLFKDQEKKENRLTYLNQQKKDFQKELDEYEIKLKNIVDKLNENEKEIEEKKTLVMDKLDDLSENKAKRHNINSSLEDLKEKEEKTKKEEYSLIIEKDKEKMEADDLSLSIINANKKIKEHQNALADISELEKKKDTLLNEKVSRLSAIINDIDLKTSRRKMLENMEESLEGYYKSVKMVLKAAKYDDELGRGIHGAVAQLINTKEDYETAITMALGASVQNIVTEDENTAKLAIEYLKRERAGRATFLPLTSVKGRSLDYNTINELKKTKGFTGIGSEIVKCDSLYKPVIESLLGRTAIFDNIDSAIVAAKKFSYSFRIVTLEGEVFNPGGSISGGNIDKGYSGLLGRTREIEKLKQDVTEQKELKEKISSEIKDIRKELDITSKDKELLERDLKDQELIKIRDESHKKQLDGSIKKLELRLLNLNSEKENDKEKEENLKSDLEKYTMVIDKIEESINNIKEEIDDFTKKHQGHQSERDELHADINDYKVSVNSIIESIESIKENITQSAEERKHLEKVQIIREEEIKKNDIRIKDIADDNIRIKKEIGKHETEKTGKTLEIDRITEEREVLERDMNDTMFKITDMYRENLTV